MAQAEVNTTAEDAQRTAVRATLAKIDPGMVAMLDAVKAMDPAAKLVGVQAVQDGEWRGLGRMSTFPKERKP